MVTSTRARRSETFLRTSSPLSRPNARLPDSLPPDGAELYCGSDYSTERAPVTRGRTGGTERLFTSKMRARTARRARRSKRCLQRCPRRRAGLECPFQAGYELAPELLRLLERRENSNEPITSGPLSRRSWSAELISARLRECSG